MIKTITVPNVNYGLQGALWHLKTSGVIKSSRNGPVLVAPEPVVTTYTNPMQRVMFSALRDANPFFHHMEAIWMLAGSNDVHFPSRYAKQIAQYSDDGNTLHGAYGYRWRKWFGYDQLAHIIEMLRADPWTRRAVLSMWDAGGIPTSTDDPTYAKHGGLDVPCNTHIYFNTALNGHLDMTVCCRSNDAVWGCYGANAVHFSMLHQFIAEAAGVPVGHYHQFSNDLHVYIGRPDVARLISEYGGGWPSRTVHYTPDDRYSTTALQFISPTHLVKHTSTWHMFLSDAEKFVSDPDGDHVYDTGYFASVVVPMQIAHTAYKAGDIVGALEAVRSIHAMDWQIACREWLNRRMKNEIKA